MAKVTDFFSRHKSYGIKVFAALSLEEIVPARLSEILTKNVIDEIYFAFSRNSGVKSETIDAYLEIAEKSR